MVSVGNAQQSGCLATITVMFGACQTNRANTNDDFNRLCNETATTEDF